MEMCSPPASKSQDVTDGKLKSNLVWPNPAKPGSCFQSFNTSLTALKAEKIKITSRQVWFSRPQKRRLGRDVYKSNMATAMLTLPKRAGILTGMFLEMSTLFCCVYF